MAKQTEKQLDRVEAKVDKIQEHIGSIDVTLGAQHVSLVEHMKRTELLEKAIAPIQSHVDMVKGVAKFIGLLAAGGTIVEMLRYFFGG